MSQITQLASVKTISGKLKVEGSVASGVLTLETEQGELEMTLSQFDAIYAGFVRCWPVVRPLKEQVGRKQRELVQADAKKAKEERDAKRAEEKAKAKADREAAAEAKAAAKAKAKAKATKPKATKSKAKAKAKKANGSAKPEPAQAAAA